MGVRFHFGRGRDSVVGTATRYGSDGSEFDPGGDEIFSTRPEWPWGPPSLLTRVTGSFPGIQRPGVAFPNPLTYREVKERVDLNLYSSSVP